MGARPAVQGKSLDGFLFGRRPVIRRMVRRSLREIRAQSAGRSAFVIPPRLFYRIASAGHRARLFMNRTP